jgi:hypothetical protein
MSSNDSESFHFDRDVVDRLFDESLSKRATLVKAAKEFLSGIHQSNREAGVAWLKDSYVPAAREIVRVDGPLEHLLKNLSSKLIELRPSADPLRTPASEIERCFAAFRSCEWVELEIDLIQAQLVIDEKIEMIDSRAVRTSRKTIDRAKLRQESRPVNWSNVESWSKQFPRMI